MNKEKDTITRKSERALLLLLLFSIPIILISYFICGNHKFLFSISIMLSISALLQLEITGLFGDLDDLENELSEIPNESGLAPSHITVS